jgi:hypothetical protein
VDNVTPRPLYLRERDPVPIVQEAGWDHRVEPGNSNATGKKAKNRPTFLR